MTSAQLGSKKGGEENVGQVLFHVRECYVYIIPPRRTAAAHRADDWNINKWAWEGAMKITLVGEECTIRLEDNGTGELYAQAPLRADQPLPVEAVVDSSRFFVLRIEDSSADRTKHAFIGVGFRERTQAYDFQVALYDHVACLHNKEEEAQVIEQDCEFNPLQVKSHLKMSPKTRVFDENFDISFLKKALPTPRLGKSTRSSAPRADQLTSTKPASTGVDVQSPFVLPCEKTLSPALGDELGEFQARLLTAGLVSRTE